MSIGSSANPLTQAPPASAARTQTPHVATPTQAMLAPGVTIECRDERWLVTQMSAVSDGWRLRVRGLSDFVRDTTATFFTALDQDIKVFDPTEVAVIPDNTPKFRYSRLWLESILRTTPVPLYQDNLEVSKRMLLDPLEYQLSAVRSALSPERTRPRVLLADAVGLGKTLEIGMILAELIRRGRGERILVVTPRHVLEQFQQELWTRFAIPLVRLDSQGIQKVRQKLPASKNPFTYFPRVIVSIDTLKAPKFRAQLEKVRWDAVVIDEIHNAINAGSQNNQLARTLAPTTESLILASATPHNGNPESFKELLRLLDPLAVGPDGTIDAEAAKRLIIRRHRNTPEVASKVGANWAKRLEPNNIMVSASPEELAVAEEIETSWLSAKQEERLFPWTLLKAFLSSPAALQETIENRAARTQTSSNVIDPRLAMLAALNEKVTPAKSAKFNRLLEYLKEIGVGKTSSTRVVIFSERVATLHWLRDNLEKQLKMPKGAVKVLHGQLSDEEQMQLIDEFKREHTKLRILVTGDVASEGVNLHAQCHHLVHYDIPWSLITIQQRNGRIDRYGQMHNPQITTLLLDTGANNGSEGSQSTGELRVLTRLMEREHEAHTLLGDASSLMGVHNVRAEEDSIRDVLAGKKDFDDVVASPMDLLTANISGAAEGEFSIDALLASIQADVAAEQAAPQEPQSTQTSVEQTVNQQRSLSEQPVAKSLYPSEIDYLTEALDEAFHSVPHDPPAAGGVSFRKESNGIAEFIPPSDLQRRFDFLPQDYVEYRNLKEQLVLATNQSQGNLQLQIAREGDSEKTWPKGHYLGPLHPVLSWASDRALSKFKQSEIPAFAGTVDQPSVLLMGTLTNAHGQVVTRSFHIVTPGPFGLHPEHMLGDDAAVEGITRVTEETISDPYSWLLQHGLGTDAISSGALELPEDTQLLVTNAVHEVTKVLDTIQQTQQEDAEQRTARWVARADKWQQGMKKTATSKRAAQLINQEQEILRASTPKRALVRPLAVIVPR